MHDMHELTPETITEAVLEQMATTSDPRLKAVMAAAVKHMHAFAREVNLTPAEWLKGIEFMTAVGKKCTAERQEFILLSDTLGLSALVNGLHDLTAVEDATHTSLLGPFFRENAPKLAYGAQIANKATPSTEIALWGKITNVQGEPLANAEVSVWQTGADGLYDIQVNASGTDYRGVFTTDGQGNFLIRTVRPLGYSIPMDGPVGSLIKAQGRHGMRPAHIHFLVSAPGYRELVTALYVQGDPHIADDVVFGSSEDLVAEVRENDPACPVKGVRSMRFDLSLSRESAADKATGRVGADPSAIFKAEANHAAAGAARADAGKPAKQGLFGALFGR
jgi:catechol 1,2-dioxygenase/hydroxyquinol 1,2-dioxygenase